MGRETGRQRWEERQVAIVGELHRRGVTIVPGTDNIAGYTYHRELELYVKSGIPANEVLQLATIGAARVAGVDAKLGSVEVGKVADLVLVEGDVNGDVTKLRGVAFVMKDGLVIEN